LQLFYLSLELQDKQAEFGDLFGEFAGSTGAVEGRGAESFTCADEREEKKVKLRARR
jgi:hypothetical protein